MPPSDPSEYTDEDRIEQHASLQEDGVDPYPPAPPLPDCRITEFTETHSEEIDNPDEETRLAGRITRVNDLGSIGFVDVRDETGTIQLLLREESVGEYNLIDSVQKGDIVTATGTPTYSNTGELSLEVEEWQMLTKALRHPAWASYTSGFSNQKRVTDRAAALQLRDLNDSIRSRFELQREIRDYLNDRGYIEVETPILHRVAGGAEATPFETHLNALDEDVYLRIAPELYLKRMLVGGFDRVYEIGRDFRNEDVDTSHQPEFTMLELYEAYSDYEEMMELTEQVVSEMADRITGSQRVVFNGEEIDLSPPWERIEMVNAIEEYGGIDVDQSVEALRHTVIENGGSLGDNSGRDECYMELYDMVAEDAITGPTFVTHHPASSTPLCETQPEDPTRLQRFEAVVGGVELANAYTELRDPIEQAEAFRRQAERTGGEVDMDFVEALACGMPPAGGLGIGIDRLAMILLGRDSIKDVVAFPFSG